MSCAVASMVLVWQFRVGRVSLYRCSVFTTHTPVPAGHDVLRIQSSNLAITCHIRGLLSTLLRKSISLFRSGAIAAFAEHRQTR
jgi:hypothetical protein